MFDLRPTVHSSTKFQQKSDNSRLSC